MSTPLGSQQQQPPPMAVTQQAYTAHSGHGSVGPVIAVLAVITILGVIAGMIGRLCSGRSIMGHGRFDLESWVETKCSTCLDGRVDFPPAPAAQTPDEGDSGESAPADAAVAQEIKQEEQRHHEPPVATRS